MRALHREAEAARREAEAAKKKLEERKPIKAGEKKTAGNIVYKVLNAKARSVSVFGVKNKKLTKITIPKAVRIKGLLYQVTEIGAKSFYNCKKLKKVCLKADKVKRIGSKAFGKIHRKAVIYVPKSKGDGYGKMLKKAGMKMIEKY